MLEGAWREVTILENVGDAFDGTKEANGLGRKEVVSADGLRVFVVAGSGSTSSRVSKASGVVRGSAGVKKDAGDAVKSSQISRSWVWLCELLVE